MRFAIVAHRSSETNERLAAAATELGFDATVLPPREALRVLEPGDLALGRLDVCAELDGIERGTVELERLSTIGVEVLNPPSALVAAHDKLLTARALRLAGLPHPHTWLIADGMPSPAPELPLVLKPRFGSWGQDVTLCATREELDLELERIATARWYREHGALAQELVPPLGWDIRLVVSGGQVVGAARRIAAVGEWRTNVALGARREPVLPPDEACEIAVRAAGAVDGALVGVDLLPAGLGTWVVLEVNGAVEFNSTYSFGEDVFEAARRALLGTTVAVDELPVEAV